MSTVNFSYTYQDGSKVVGVLEGTEVVADVSQAPLVTKGDNTLTNITKATANYTKASGTTIAFDSLEDEAIINLSQKNFYLHLTGSSAQYDLQIFAYSVGQGHSTSTIVDSQLENPIENQSHLGTKNLAYNLA